MTLQDDILDDPAGVALEARATLAERHLIDFIRLMWPVLEPGREFVEGWAVEAVCEHLEAVTRGEIKRLLINIPPGCMKSLTTNVFWPAWEWGPVNRPDLRYMSASYAEALAVRDNRRCRQLIESELYQQLWGDRFSFADDQNAKGKYENSERGFRFATSVGGLATGERGDRLIMDDPHSVRDSESQAVRDSTLGFYTETWSTRTTNDSAAFVTIMQRVHEQDVSGLILEKLHDYEHLMLPMEFERERKCSTSIGFEDPRTDDGDLLWPERFSAEHLEGELKPMLRAHGGTYAEAGQLQQRPAPRKGGMFQRDDFRFVDAPPDKVRSRVRGWDFAATDNAGAYTAGVKISVGSDGVVYIEDVVRARWGPSEVERNFTATAEQDSRSVLIDIPQDPGQAGKTQVMHMARLVHGHTMHSSPETGSKEQRAGPLAAQAEVGNLAIVRGPWNDAFINEATMFPTGKYRDQVDAASRAYARASARTKRRIGRAPEVINQT